MADPKNNPVVGGLVVPIGALCWWLFGWPGAVVWFVGVIYGGVGTLINARRRGLPIRFWH